MAEPLQPRPPRPAAGELGLLLCLLPAPPGQREHGKTHRHYVPTHTHWIYLPLKQSLMI